MHSLISPVLRTDLLYKYTIPIGLLILNFILKVIYLDYNPVSNDEPFSIYIAQMDIPSIISQLSQGNNPPLFEIILHYWIRIFGISAFSVRFLPFLFSVLTVYFIYKIGISFFNPKVGLIASLIYTFSNYHLYFSQETRVYSLFALLTVISMFAFLNLIKNEKSKFYLITLIVINVLLVYSHYFGFFIVFIQSFCVLFLKEVRVKLLKIYLVSVVVLFVFYLPNLLVLWTRFIDSTTKGTWVSPVSFDEGYNMLRRFFNAPVTTVFFIIIMSSAIVKLIINKFQYISKYSKVISVWFILPFLITFILSLKYFSFNIPIFFDRYLTFVSIGLYFLLALSIDYLIPERKFYNYLIVIPIAFMLMTYERKIKIKRPVNEIVEKLKDVKTDNTLIYFSPHFFNLNFAYYYNLDYFKDYNETNIYENLDNNFSKENIFGINNQDQIDTNLISTAGKVIFLDAASEFTFPDNNIVNKLSKYFKQSEKHNFSHYNLYIFDNKLKENAADIR